MRIWAEVWDASQTNGYGIVTLAGATVARRLDGAGSMDISIATGDSANVLLQPGRWVHVYSDYPHGEKHLIERGILQRYKLSVVATPKATWQCSDASVAFKQANTYRGLVYINQPVENVIRDLVGRVAGWTVIFDGAVDGLYTTQRFDGVNILKAISKVATAHGLHWCITPGQNQLKFGRLGGEIALRVSNVATGDEAIRANSGLALIESLSQTINQGDMVTRIEPISGPSDGALTLRFATKSEPYPIKTMTRNGRTVYYLEDAAAVAEYGVIEEVIAPKSLIAPVANTSFADVANTLYDWGATQLRRRSQPQRVYDCKVTKLAKALNPGDQIFVDYDGDVIQMDGTAVYADIHEILWVLKITESYTDAGMSAALQVSNVDEEAPDAVNVLASAVMNAEEARTAVAVNINSSQTRQDVALGGGTVANMTVSLPNRAIGVTSCQITLTRASASAPGAIELKWDGAEIAGVFLNGSTLTETVDIAETVITGTTVAGDHTLSLYAGLYAGTLHVVVNAYSVIAGADS